MAFVSTNSITQGEQAGVLWPWLLGHGVTIRFAHRTFRWSNEGKGVAAVHCVIVGFGLQTPAKRTLYLYPDGIKGEPTALPAKNINPYLADAPDVDAPNPADRLHCQHSPTARLESKRAAHQANLLGVNFGRRSPGSGGQNCMPNDKVSPGTHIEGNVAWLTNQKCSTFRPQQTTPRPSPSLSRKSDNIFPQALVLYSTS